MSQQAFNATADLQTRHLRGSDAARFPTFEVIACAMMALVVWARMTASVVHLPSIGGSTIGILLAVAGLLVLGLGLGIERGYRIHDLRELIGHPLHFGFGLAWIGIAMAMRSGSGLYLIGPVVIAVCFALARTEVTAPEFRRRDNAEPAASHAASPALWRRLLPIALAPDDDRPPTLAARLSVFPLLFIPWLVLYECVLNFGPLPGAFEGYLPGEVHWPILQWMEPIYFSPYVLVTLVPFVATTNRLLRRFTIAGLLGTAICDFVFLVVPAIATPRPFVPHGSLGAMMLWERVMDRNNGTGALPSPHVVWSFLGASIFLARWPRSRFVAWPWAVMVSLGCIFTGMHATVDVVAGFAVYLLTWFHRPIWRALSDWAQRLGQLPPHAVFDLIWNGLIVLGLLRLWRLSVPGTFILGSCLILQATGRLVCDSCDFPGGRDCPDVSPLVPLLRAGAAIVTGAILTCCRLPSPHGTPWLLGGALALAMGRAAGPLLRNGKGRRFLEQLARNHGVTRGPLDDADAMDSLVHTGAHP